MNSIEKFNRFCYSNLNDVPYFKFHVGGALISSFMNINNEFTYREINKGN